MIFETKNIPIKDLKRNIGQIPDVPKNPRLIKDNNFRKLKESILQDPEMLDLREIIAYNHNGQFVIIGGNMRFEALKALNYTTAKCKVISDVSTEQLKRIILKDNSAFGEWDFDDLANEWEETLLTACAIDVPIFDEPKAEEEAEEDNFNPEETLAEKETTVKEGDIWQLGKHRLYCGDCTVLADVLKFMQGRHADMVLTDPPYNVAIEEKMQSMRSVRVNARTDKKQDEVKNDKLGNNEFKEFLTKFYNVAAEVLKPGGAMYVWHSNPERINFETAAPSSLIYRDTLTWAKNHFSLSRKDYQQKTEPCLYFVKQGKTHYFTAQRNLTTLFEDLQTFDSDKATKDELKEILTRILELPSNVLYEDKPLRNADHPTMKPVKLFGRQIKASSRIGEIIFDPFGGSGTSVIAAEQLKRVCYIVELSPVYCDVIIRRWEELTGNTAVKIENIKQINSD